MGSEQYPINDHVTSRCRMVSDMAIFRQLQEVQDHWGGHKIGHKFLGYPTQECIVDKLDKPRQAISFAAPASNIP
jgi:hypothetical protein